MQDEQAVEAAARAIEAATQAWDSSHRGLGSNPMTRTAATPMPNLLTHKVQR